MKKAIQFHPTGAATLFGAFVSLTHLSLGAVELPGADASEAVAAAAADVPPSAELQSIVVTAQKRAERIQNVPASVSAIDGNDVLSNELRSTKDIAREVPGATAWNAESRARPRFFIRGVGSNEATNNAVQPIGIYYDEVYLLNSLFLGAPLFDLKRVEVLRGPQGTLWGKNTTGGAYNFVSQRPTFQNDGYLKLEAGNYGQKLVEGAFGGPIKDDVLAQRLSLHHEERDGWASNRLNGHSAGDLRDDAARYQLLARITPELEANLNVHYRDYHATQTPTYAVTRPGAPTFGYTTPLSASGDRALVDFNGGDQTVNVRSHGVTGTINWEINGLTLSSITAFDSGTRETPPQDSDYTPVEVSRSYGKNKSRQYSQELRLASPKTDRLNWIAGAYYFHDKNDSFASAATTLPVSTINSALTYTSYTQKTDSKAVFGSLTYNLNERASVSGGLRYTSETVGIDLTALGSVGLVNGVVPFASNNWWQIAAANTPLKTIATQNTENTWHNLGYDFTPQYKIADNQLAYFRLATGFRSGNYAGASVQAPPAVVTPEKLLSYELGYKSEWFNRRLIFNTSAYYYDYKDMQLTVNRVIGGNFVSVLANAGQGEVKGVEFELQGKPTRELSLRANLSALHTKFKQFTTGTTSYAGYNFARVPNTSGLLGAEYRIGLGGGTLLLASDWSYNSKVNFNATNNTDPYTLQEAFWLGTVRASYHFPDSKVTLGLYVNNVSNKEYKIQGQLYSNSRYNTTLGDPRTAGASLTYKF